MEENVSQDVVQEQGIKPKKRITAKVVKTSLAGGALDLGDGTKGVIHISQLVHPTNEPIKRVEDVLQVGKEVDVWVRRVRNDQIELTMIEPLALEWREIKPGLVVKGSVVRLEKFGAFVEIGAERPGLLHISEMAHGYVKAPSDVVKEGDEIDVQVIEANRRKKQIKLSLKALVPEPVKEEPVRPTEMENPRSRPERGKRSSKSEPRDESGSEMTEKKETAPAEIEPTAMEVALREAMQKAKTTKHQSVPKQRRGKTGIREQEELLSRTLEQKAKN